MKRRIFQNLSILSFKGYYPGFLNAFIYQGTMKQFCTPIINCYACPAALLACTIGSLQHFIIINQTIPYYTVGFLPSSAWPWEG